jgi:hypothetical protein
MYVKSFTATIKVVDQYGNPVLGATLAVRDENDPSNETRYVTDANGAVQMELDPMSFYSAWVYDCPVGYSTDHAFKYLFYPETEYTFVILQLDPNE